MWSREVIGFFVFFKLGWSVVIKEFVSEGFKIFVLEAANGEKPIWGKYDLLYQYLSEHMQQQVS